MLGAVLVLGGGASVRPRQAPAGDDGARVRGMTISCQTYGPEWGRDGFGDELDRLRALGVNWVAIHPYASIRADGEVVSRFDADAPPAWVTRPIEEAHARGMQILVKPHIAYWGSPFSWRGDIAFDDAGQWERFFASYERWIVTLARIARGADAFAVGTELDRTLAHESQWRAIIGAVREQTSAHLTYAANWSDFERVGFWDALDAVGVQAYFPLVTDERLPDESALRAGWSEPLRKLRALHVRTGKPVVFTELGYDRSLAAALRPWESGRRRRDDPGAAGVLQERCLSVALGVLEEETTWLRGAFLWKWFVGPSRSDYRLDRPAIRELMATTWTR
ncbi:MAG: hypothetical protein GY711_06230 [bacterium]|nr:hypothetical protein [bacterium]